MTKMNHHTIFLLHGFHSDSAAMGDVFKYLKRNFNPVLLELPLSFQDPLLIVKQLKKQILANKGNKDNKISFIGHSTGGIIIRMLMNDPDIAVMTQNCIFIGVPNHGTELAELHGLLPEVITKIHLPVKYLTKKAIRDLNLIKPDNVSYAGIAGNQTIDLTQNLFSSPNDGVVSVKSVFMNEMIDFIELSYNHFDLTNQLITCKLIESFLNNKHFINDLKENDMTLSEKFEYIVREGYIDDLCRYSNINIAISTAGGKVWWNTLAQYNGWKLQQNKLTNHVRILNPEDIRKAWGSDSTIFDAIERVFSKIKIEKVNDR
jgi:hypothetical protein